MSEDNEIIIQKQEIISQMTEAVFYPEELVDRAELEKCKSFNLSEIALLGASFSCLASSLTIPGKSGLYRVAIPKNGHLAKYKSGEGYLGSVLSSNNKLQGQATLNPVAIEPMSLIMAIALSSINCKLDEIKETQNEIMSFLSQKEKSELRGDLNFLSDIYNNYKFNYNNDTYIKNNHNKVLDIKQEAERKVDFYHHQIEAKMSKKMLFKIDRKIDKMFADVIEDFSDYQISLYIYAFSSFVDVLLLENFETDFLKSVTDKIDKYSLEYRKLYTDVYYRMEESKNQSLQSTGIKGIAKTSKFAKKMISKVPIINNSEIDEKLISASDKMDKIQSKRTEESLKTLTSKKSTCVKPFIDNINTIDYLYNKANEVLIDQDKIYIESY